MELTPTQQQKMGQLRQLLQTLGMLAAAVGWGTPADIANWTTIILQAAGPAMMIGGFAWDWWANRRKAILQSAATTLESAPAAEKAMVVKAVADLPEVKAIDLDKTAQATPAINAATPVNVTVSCSMLAVVFTALFVLSGCVGPSILQGGTSLTAPVNNPVSRESMLQIETAYYAAVRLAVAYRRLPLCRTGETASLTRLCAQRSVILTLQSANAKARFALTQMRTFVRDHPTINAIEFVQLARQAVGEFQAVAASTGRTS